MEREGQKPEWAEREVEMGPHLSGGLTNLTGSPELREPFSISCIGSRGPGFNTIVLISHWLLAASGRSVTLGETIFFSWSCIGAGWH